MNLLEILDKIIGGTGFNGCTRADDESMKNLELLEDIIYHLNNKLTKNMRLKVRQEKSAKEIYKYSKEILENIGLKETD